MKRMKAFRAADMKHWNAHFYAALQANEALHNLIIGLADQLQAKPPLQTPFLGGCFYGGQACLAAINIPDWILVLGACSDQALHAIPHLVEALAHENINLAGVNGEAELARTFAQAWQRVTGNKPVLQIAQQVYVLKQLKASDNITNGGLRLAQIEDIPQLTKWYGAFIDQASPDKDAQISEIEVHINAVQKLIASQSLFVWQEQGKAVSMIGLLRETRRGVAISLAYTPPAERGKGYGTACLRALSELQLAHGKDFCCLYADIDNPTTNHISQSTGYESIAECRQYAFQVLT